MNISLLCRPALIAALLAAGVGQAATPMYKWVDEQGNVQYSQTPPKGVKVQTLAPPPPPPVSEEEAGKKLEAAQEAMKPEEPDANKKKTEAAEKARNEQFKQNCENARQNLKTYSDTANARFKHPDGTVEEPDEAQRAARIKEAQTSVDKFCNAAPADKNKPAAAQ